MILPVLAQLWSIPAHLLLFVFLIVDSLLSDSKTGLAGRTTLTGLGTNQAHNWSRIQTLETKGRDQERLLIQAPRMIEVLWFYSNGYQGRVVQSHCPARSTACHVQIYAALAYNVLVYYTMIYDM